MSVYLYIQLLISGGGQCWFDMQRGVLLVCYVYHGRSVVVYVISGTNGLGSQMGWVHEWAGSMNGLGPQFFKTNVAS